MAVTVTTDILNSLEDNTTMALLNISTSSLLAIICDKKTRNSSLGLIPTAMPIIHDDVINNVTANWTATA